MPFGLQAKLPVTSSAPTMASMSTAARPAVGAVPNARALIHPHQCFRGAALPRAPRRQSFQHPSLRTGVRVTATQTIGTQPLFAAAKAFGGGGSEVFVAGGELPQCVSSPVCRSKCACILDRQDGAIV